MSETTFETKLSVLTSLELSDASGDPDRMGVMIERLLNGAAFAIAIAAKGDKKAMDEFLQGAEIYLYEAAAGHQRIGAFMGQINSHKRRNVK